MKVTAAVIVLLAIVIAVVPQFTDCQSQGMSIKLANGTSIPMKCHWTAMAELGLALPIGAVGLSGGFSGKKEARRLLGMVGVVLGAVAIAIPTVFIGVCAKEDMLCNAVMRPTLILGGVLVIGLSLANIFLFGRGKDAEGVG